MVLGVMTLSALSFTNHNLRSIYSRPPSQWPAPSIDPGVKWNELGPITLAPGDFSNDSVRKIIELGKILFFDNRLSGSMKISCATCHKPEMSWTDRVEKSAGHEGSFSKRNAQTILNSWFYDRLFWDGRSSSLEDQAFSPINSETEMHGDMPGLPRRLKKINAYPELFNIAFGDPEIDPDKIASALAHFQRTLSSSPSKFDRFLQGDKKALSNSELKGLHLFRTKARCMNCHHGSMFSDDGFHNNGFHTDAEIEKDKGYYNVSHDENDMGKFRTPSLRDVVFTNPWMHSGKEKSLETIIEHYSKMITRTDSLLKPLALSKKERANLLAFLGAISTQPPPFNPPVLPQ